MKWSVSFLFLLFLVTPAIGGDMQKGTTHTYAYFYSMEGTPEGIKQAVPAHVEYWKSLKLDGYYGGPFGDNSGGMVVFKAESAEKAKNYANGDPFVIHNLVKDSWVKPWIIH